MKWQGISLLGSQGNHNLMGNMNKNGRKEYEQPIMKVVIIDSADIIATSSGTKGRGKDMDGDEEW